MSKEAMLPSPGPVKISQEKMATEGIHIDFMFLTPPPHSAPGSATDLYLLFIASGAVVPVTKSTHFWLVSKYFIMVVCEKL